MSAEMRLRELSAEVTNGSEDGFHDYIEMTVDPGVGIILGTILVCFLSFALVPCLVICSRRRNIGSKKQQETYLNEENHTTIFPLPTPLADRFSISNLASPIPLSDTVSILSIPSVLKSPSVAASIIVEPTIAQQKNGTSLVDFEPGEGGDVELVHSKTLDTAKSSSPYRPKSNNMLDLHEVPLSPNKSRALVRSSSGSIASVDSSIQSSVISTASSFVSLAIASRPRKSGCVSRTNRRLKKTVDLEMFSSSEEIELGPYGQPLSPLRTGPFIHLQYGQRHTPAPLQLVDLTHTQDVTEQIESSDYQILCGKNAIWKPRVLCLGFRTLVDLAILDKESTRVITLAVPLILNQVLDALFNNLQLAVISWYLGTDAVAAAAMAQVFVGMTAEFLGGLIAATTSLLSHAVGTGNNYLAGQYIQQSVLLFSVVSIPNYFLWIYLMEGAILWTGLSAHVATLAVNFTPFVLGQTYLFKVSQAMFALLEVIDRERFPTVMYLFMGATQVLCSWAALNFMKDGTLVTVGWILVSVKLLTLVISIAVPLLLGWITPFLKGIFGNVSINNVLAFRNLAKTAFPLAFGSLLAYGEWEVLTIFCAHLGPAEVATWAILGYIWELFEACTEAIGDASEIRVGSHLGKGRPEMAELAAYKSCIWAQVMATFLTSLLFILSDILPKLYTQDATLRYLMSEVFPLVGIGNMTMTFGMVCWAIIGAQGRYSLATKIATFSSWGVTLPLAAISVYALNFDLQGVVASVSVGYSICGMMMAYVMMTSDWKELSVYIQERNAETGEMESDSEEDESSSSGSASSRSSFPEPLTIEKHSEARLET